MKFGICGFGKMGQIRADAIARRNDCALQIAFDPEPFHDANIPFASSIDAVIERSDVDAVFLCLPNYLNKQTTMAALRAGKHVFCEKPPAFTEKDVDEIRHVEQASGKTLMYGFNHRQHDGVLAMADIVRSRRYGRPLWARGRYGKSVDADYLKGWRAQKELAGGGILIDQGIHMVDLLLMIAGQPFDEISAMVSNMYWQTDGIEDNVFALLRVSETGFSASLHSTMTQWRHLFSLEVFMERGYCVLNGLKTSSGTYGEEVLTIAKNRSKAPAANWDDEERIIFSEDRSWDKELSIFVEAIRNGEPPSAGCSLQAKAVMNVIDRIYVEKRHEAGELFGALQAG
ncbi:Gfo/Idh/MocA family protein [Sphingobium xanthum]|uniref:Gfo/Idh/MocA family protein n=1 Tax=Sphingobium xanthum TaxID=1387165 RepID=UPI002484CF4C|nr:Gfo/Idh/MocA family oxidoreductase [Sphingobium xanthum]